MPTPSTNWPDALVPPLVMPPELLREAMSLLAKVFDAR